MIRGRWTSIAGWVLSLAALVFVVRLLLHIDASAWKRFGDLNIWWLAVSAFLWFAWFAWRYVLWERISRRHGYEAKRHANLRMWTISELMRYIPGNVWSFGARYQGTVNSGTTKRGALQALVLEAVSLVAGAGVVSLAALGHGWWLILGLAGIAMYVVVVPRLLPNAWKRWRLETMMPVDSRELSLLLCGYIVVWLLYGLANATMYWAFPHMPAAGAWVLIGVNVFSWLVGYVSIITPMGLGVREVTFVGLTGHFLSSSIAGTVALLSRIWMVMCELVFVLVIIIYIKIKS